MSVVTVEAFEEWRPCPGRRDVYEVSSLGRVRNAKTGRVLRAGVNRDGYRKVTIDQRAGLRPAQRHVNRLICEAFHGPAPFDGAHARHLDGDSLNNLPENLAWGSVRENTDDRMAHGTQVRGERISTAKLTRSQVLEIRRRFTWRLWGTRRVTNAKALASEFGVLPTTIREIAAGRSWHWVAQ